MNNFTVMTYDQIIQKITQHNPNIAPSVYLYESIELRHIVPVFFLKHRVTIEPAFQKYHHARFSGWATGYDDELHDFFQIGQQYSDSDTVSFKRVALLHAIRLFEWESLPDGYEKWEVNLKPPFFPSKSEDQHSGFSVSRAQVHFWLTDDSELNQSDAKRTNTATVNQDDQTTHRVPIYTQPDTQLLAILDANHPDHAPDLAIAVKLWLDLYGRDEKTKHSHSHGADLFLGKEQLQSTAKERIKEITSPIKNWNKQRLGAYNNAKK